MGTLIFITLRGSPMPCLARAAVALCIERFRPILLRIRRRDSLTGT